MKPFKFYFPVLILLFLITSAIAHRGDIPERGITSWMPATSWE